MLETYSRVLPGQKVRENKKNCLIVPGGNEPNIHIYIRKAAIPALDIPWGAPHAVPGGNGLNKYTQQRNSGYSNFGQYVKAKCGQNEKYILMSAGWKRIVHGAKVHSLNVTSDGCMVSLSLSDK